MLLAAFLIFGRQAPLFGFEFVPRALAIQGSLFGFTDY